AARGLELDIGRVRPGLLSIHLGDARVKLEGTPVLQATFEHVEVRVTPWLSLRGVVVDGGEVTLEGSGEHVREQLEAWRGRHRRASSAGKRSARSSLPITAEGINVRWLRAEHGT